MTSAALGNDTAALEALIERGAPIDAFDRSGVTPLLAAAFGGAPDAVGFLLARGADPS
ncbi:MAG: ankyrin repeat domain-containing protein, partial [Mesorhizobium sp.]